MAKQITYGDASRQAILRGVNSLTHAVRVTLGPRGRNVILDRQYGSPTITKDGVTVAKEIHLKDALENMGAQMVKEVASKDNTTIIEGAGNPAAIASRVKQLRTQADESTSDYDLRNGKNAWPSSWAAWRSSSWERPRKPR